MTLQLRPPVSPEHGSYVIVVAALTTGLIAAGGVTVWSSLAIVLAMVGLQAEHAWSLVLRRRRDRISHAAWGAGYAVIALGCACVLAWQTPALLGVYMIGSTVLLVDLWSILQGDRKGIVNELVGFAGLCLASVLAYASVTGAVNAHALAIWLLDLAYFGSSVFLVKLRKPRSNAFRLGLIYHVIAAIGLTFVVLADGLSLAVALAFLIAPIKFHAYAANRSWFCSIKIQIVGLLETAMALGFLLWIAVAFYLESGFIPIVDT